METKRMITVYGAPPSRALRVCWMLEELNIPYDIRSVNFQTRFEDKEFMAVSPAGALPGIRDGDTTLFDSCAIIEYLGAKYGPTPLAPKPTDPHYPAYISYLHFGEASLSAPLNITIATKFFAPEEHKQNWGAQFAIDLFVRRSAALLGPLSRSPYLAGDVFTAADISCGYAIGLSRFFGFEERLEKPLREYAGRLTQRPAYQRAAANAQPVAL
jgi:glutathione S-transferase